MSQRRDTSSVAPPPSVHADARRIDMLPWSKPPPAAPTSEEELSPASWSVGVTPSTVLLYVCALWGALSVLTYLLPLVLSVFVFVCDTEGGTGWDVQSTSGHLDAGGLTRFYGVCDSTQGGGKVLGRDFLLDVSISSHGRFSLRGTCAFE